MLMRFWRGFLRDSSLFLSLSLYFQKWLERNKKMNGNGGKYSKKWREIYRKCSRMLRSFVLILFLSRPFLEENLRDIPIFFSSFPARSFGIELEYNGGVLRKIPEICLRFSGSAHFSKRGKAEKTEDLQGQIWNKKDLMQHSKVLHKVSFFRFSWEVSGCANVPF